MKKLIAVLCLMLGAVALVVGGAGAVVIGPDDTISAPPSVIENGGAPVVSTPAILAFTNASVQVSASSAKGPVFLGAAHPVDVKDLVESVPHLAITGVGTSGVTTEKVAGHGNLADLPPLRDAPVWLVRAEGVGTQTLALELTDAPVAYVVSGPGPITLSQGVTVHGLWPLSLALTVVGIVLIVLGIWVLRRRRKPTTGLSTRQASASTAATPTATTAGQPGRALQVVGAGVAVALVASCSALPSVGQPYDPKNVRKSALVKSEVAGALKDYDQRNNAAIVAAAKKYDPSLWSKADDGVLLAADTFETAMEKERRSSAAPVTLTTAAAALYSPEFASYPMYAVVGTTETQAGKPAAAKPQTSLQVLLRDSARAPWRVASSVPVPLASLPAAAEPGASSTPSAADLAAALKAAESIRTDYPKGSFTGVVADQTLAALSKEFAAIKAPSQVSVDKTVEHFAAEDRTGVRGSVHVVRTTKGTVVVADYRVTGTLVSIDPITMNDQHEAVVRGLQGGRYELIWHYALSVAILVPPAGKPVVLGSINRPIL